MDLELLLVWKLITRSLQIGTTQAELRGQRKYKRTTRRIIDDSRSSTVDSHVETRTNIELEDWKMRYDGQSYN